MPFQDIPNELKAIDQWCVWHLEDVGAAKPTKVPYDAKTGKLANVNDPATWSDFATAVAYPNCSGIGFIFTHNDNYAFIDLDDTKGDQIALNRQIEIHREFDSYSEISPSGKGLHIIVRGNVPAGRRRSFIEVYSNQRYATFTGNVYNNKPIRECQDKLMQLWRQMGSSPATHIYMGDEDAKYSDEIIIKQASEAINGDKFRQLYTGQWSEAYPSQSEADLALVDIIAFYTQNKDQIGRIFRTSALGKRNKANRADYLGWMINKAFDRMLPSIDFDGFKNQLELKLADSLQSNHAALEKVPNVAGGPHDASSGTNAIALPQGLLGELAHFIYQAAPRQVADIALAGAIAFMAGIVGRAYNISGSGLNHYVMVLAKTGRGKEAVATGIDKLMNSVKTFCPTSGKFRGPSIISSGQALVRHLADVSNCCVSILGEVGITIERISNKRAVPSDKMLYQMLLDLYHKSGYGQTLPGSAYSKKENDIKSVNSPSFSIFGESTHKLFYDTLSDDMISAGLLPRFLIFDYDGKREYLNQYHSQVVPDRFMIDRLTAVVAYVEQTMASNKVVQIQCDKEAEKILTDYDVYTTDKINAERNDVIAELWNRAHIKVMRLAGLIAVGVDYLNPLIVPAYVTYAMNIVQNDIRMLTDKFNSGMVGVNSEEVKQLAQATERIKEYFTRSWEDVKSYCPSCAHMHHEKIVPYEYFNTRISTLAIFRNDKIGQTNALKRCIQTLIDNGKLEEITKTKYYADKFKRGSKRAFIAKDELFQ